jgi:DNA topoisomerase-1
VDAHDAPITDGDQLERIQTLAIPPAWTDVWISPNARARLQATGFDAAGRKQYLYHESYRAAQEQAKFDRLLEFASLLPRYRARADRQLRAEELTRVWTCALAVTVINKAWFRVGSERHARSSRTYGVTTLTKRHVTVEGAAFVRRIGSSCDDRSRTRESPAASTCCSHSPAVAGSFATSETASSPTLRRGS